MKRKITREEFIGRLNDVLAIEITARQSYEEDLATFRNIEIKDIIQKIKLDEDKHIMLIKNLLETLD